MGHFFCLKVSSKKSFRVYCGETILTCYCRDIFYICQKKIFFTDFCKYPYNAGKGVFYMQHIFVILIFFSISVGIIYFLNFLQYFLIFDRDYKKNIDSLVLILVSGHIEDIELLGRKYIAKYKVIGCFEKVRMVFLDVGLDEETRSLCERFCKSNDSFTLCDKKQFYEMLQSRTNKKV